MSDVRSTNPIDEAYDAWKQADAAARAIDDELGEAWERHQSGSGAAPERHRLREAAWLHHVARQKLADAIKLLHEGGLIQPPKGGGRHAACIPAVRPTPAPAPVA
jgi:hypothetical protein